MFSGAAHFRPAASRGPGQPGARLETSLRNTDYRDCEHCRSGSAQAYLVDLLNFLDHSDDTPNPLDRLLARRPDLENLPLNCENTNTVLPYIDLVNEVLEHYVVAGNLSGYDDFGSGTLSSEDLIATPEQTQDAAYTELKNAWYPGILPYNDPLEGLRLSCWRNWKSRCQNISKPCAAMTVSTLTLLPGKAGQQPCWNRFEFHRKNTGHLPGYTRPVLTLFLPFPFFLAKIVD